MPWWDTIIGNPQGIKNPVPGRRKVEKRKLRTFVLGLRLVANITWEKPSTVPLFVFKDNDPSADLLIAWGDSSVWNSIPLRDICSPTKSLICRNRIHKFGCETSSWLGKMLLNFWYHNHSLFLTSSSKPLKTFFCRINMWTSDAKPLKMPANSTAIYPPPIIAIFVGFEGKSRAASESIAYSLPGWRDEGATSYWN